MPALGSLSKKILWSRSREQHRQAAHLQCTAASCLVAAGNLLLHPSWVPTYVRHWDTASASCQGPTIWDSMDLVLGWILIAQSLLPLAQSISINYNANMHAVWKISAWQLKVFHQKDFLHFLLAHFFPKIYRLCSINVNPPLQVPMPRVQVALAPPEASLVHNNMMQEENKDLVTAS